MEVVELKVRLHCKACEKAVRKALCRIRGVRCVEIDVISNKITVLGFVDRKVIVRAVRRTGTKAEPWPPLTSRREEPRKSSSTGFRCINLPSWGF